MSFAKGFLLGSAGCIGGCLLTVVGLLLVVAVFFSAFVMVPIAAFASQVDAVEIELRSDAPSNAVDLVAARARADRSSRRHGNFRFSVKDHHRAWIALESRSDDATRDRVEEAIRSLEDEGTLPRGSVRIVGFVKCSPWSFHANFDGGPTVDFDRALPSQPSPR